VEGNIIKKLSEHHTERRNNYFIKLARAPADDPKVLATFKPNSLEEISLGSKKE